MHRSHGLAITLTLVIASSAAAQPGGGVPIASAVQLPTFGVSIDAGGVLALKHFGDPGGRLRAARMAAAKRALPWDIHRPTPCRKISLTRLEAELRKAAAAGRGPDETMLSLAGLLRVEYVFYFPKDREIVIAGPAEGWVPDAAGRRVGVTTRRPIVQLDDLAVAMRLFPPGAKTRPFVGCTINPTAEGLVKLRKFQATIPRVISTSQRRAVAVRVAAGMRESLGMANIEVFGVSPKTRFAEVLVEADYRMKLVGVGLEPPPVKMNTFIAQLRGSKVDGLQRWWFTPNYDCVKVTRDRLSMQLVGQGVQLQTEDKVILPDGSIRNSGRPPSKAARSYAESFTLKYPQIAAAQPVYAQMRNLIDLLVAVAFIQQEDWYGRAGWTGEFFRDESSVPTEFRPAPKQVACVANSIWRGARMFSPAGGGVSIQPHRGLQKELPDKKGDLLDWHGYESGRISAKNWWWD